MKNILTCHAADLGRIKDAFPAFETGCHYNLTIDAAINLVETKLTIAESPVTTAS